MFMVIRHADTYKNQSINVENFMNVLNKQINLIVKIIKKYKLKEIKIMSSPFERCYDTALIITNFLNLLLKTNYTVEKNENLTRWNIKEEDREQSKIRSHEYGKNMSSNNSTLTIMITHSSIIPSLCAGLSKMDLRVFKKKYNENLNNCGVSFIKNKLKFYNKMN
jgi:broad specificity phosphatase PhoE